VNQKAMATQAGVLILSALVIAAVLKAVTRMFNLLNAPINGMFLAAGAISAGILWAQERDSYDSFVEKDDGLRSAKGCAGERGGTESRGFRGVRASVLRGWRGRRLRR
jgi:hypothetical protein